MVGSTSPIQRALRRRWPIAEKRRIVELTLRSGASVRAIAREQGVHPTSLCHWKALYRAGKLGGQKHSARTVTVKPSGATFVPVSIVPALRNPPPASRTDAATHGCSVLQLVLASGATLRIETGALDAELICALVAELR